MGGGGNLSRGSSTGVLPRKQARLPTATAAGSMAAAQPGCRLPQRRATAAPRCAHLRSQAARAVAAGHGAKPAPHQVHGPHAEGHCRPGQGGQAGGALSACTRGSGWGRRWSQVWGFTGGKEAAPLSGEAGRSGKSCPASWHTPTTLFSPVSASWGRPACRMPAGGEAGLGVEAGTGWMGSGEGERRRQGTVLGTWCKQGAGRSGGVTHQSSSPLPRAPGLARSWAPGAAPPPPCTCAGQAFNNRATDGRPGKLAAAALGQCWRRQRQKRSPGCTHRLLLTLGGRLG